MVVFPSSYCPLYPLWCKLCFFKVTFLPCSFFYCDWSASHLAEWACRKWWNDIYCICLWAKIFTCQASTQQVAWIGRIGTHVLTFTWWVKDNHCALCWAADKTKKGQRQTARLFRLLYKAIQVEGMWDWVITVFWARCVWSSRSQLGS